MPAREPSLELFHAVAASWTETENACGEDVRPQLAEAASMNQEPNAIRRNVLIG